MRNWVHRCVHCRQVKNRQRAEEALARLRDQLKLQQFLQEGDELEDWLAEKSIAAQDDTYRDAKNIHSKFLRHQAFESEIAANKERLEKLEEEGEKLKDEKPEFAEVVEPKLDELRAQWDNLERTTQEKGERLFEANKHVVYEQSVDEIDGWINEIESQIIAEDVGHDLTTVNLLVQKQNVRFVNFNVTSVLVDLSQGFVFVSRFWRVS